MTYNDIINRVADNVGIENQSARFRTIAKQDIYDALLKVYRKTEPIKAEKVTTITTAAQEITVETDFFIPLEVVFKDSDGLTFASKELTLEEFLRWNPDVEVETESFNELITSATPQSLSYTQENYDLDGLVGFVFADESSIKLKWKPAIAGTVTVLYATFPTSLVTVLTDSPSIHKAYHDLLVSEVTLKHLVRRLSGANNEIQLAGINSQISFFRKERDETLSNFNGFVNRTVSTPLMEPFDFLNSPDMLILTGE